MNGALYDLLTRGFERVRGAELRRRALAGAAGRVLEIGAGTGANLPHYPRGVVDLVLTEPSRSMAARAVRRAERAGRDASLLRCSADALPFEDATFDGVVSTLVLCTVPDQPRALAEIRRVLRPGGSFLFFEHVRWADPARARWQDRLERPWRLVAGGCRPNRATIEAIEAAGFHVVELERGELPPFPAVVRPYVVGRAVSPGAGSSNASASSA